MKPACLSKCFLKSPACRVSSSRRNNHPSGRMDQLSLLPQLEAIARIPLPGARLLHDVGKTPHIPACSDRIPS